MDKGSREKQEDSILFSSESVFATHGFLAVLSDGMGGLQDGEKFSDIATKTMVSTFEESEPESPVDFDLLEKLVSEGNNYTQAVAIGPMIMMKFTTLTAKKLGLPIVVSLNTLMVDGTGMCGACRVTVAGKTRFACVEGPEFNGYDVDFDEAMRRQGQYRTEETEARENHVCRIGRG